MNLLSFSPLKVVNLMSIQRHTTFLLEGKRNCEFWENPFEKVGRKPSACNCQNNVYWENDDQLLLSLERGHRAWFGGISFIPRCQVWDPIEVDGKIMGNVATCRVCQGAAEPVSAPNFVSLSNQCIWSSRLAAQAPHSQARAGLGWPAEARPPRERI